MRGFFLAGVVPVLVLACGPGGSTASYEQSRSVRQILSDADLATMSSHSFHLSVNETAESGPVSAEMDMENGNANGKVIANGIRVRIQHIAEQTFIFGSDLVQILQTTNARSAAAVSAKASDRWVLVPNDIWTSGFGKAFDVSKMSSCLKGLTTAAKKGTTAISGEAAVELDGQAGTRIYVQTRAPHHFVRVVFPSPDRCATDPTAKSQTIDLSGYGTNFRIAPPSGYADLAALAAAG